MSEYKYAILCEDVTHRTFVKHILPVLAKQTLPDIVITEDENFGTNILDSPRLTQ